MLSTNDKGCFTWAVIITLFVVVFWVISWIFTLLWGWVIPDVFAGAVSQGTIPASLTVWQGFKVMVFVTILTYKG